MLAYIQRGEHNTHSYAVAAGVVFTNIVLESGVYCMFLLQFQERCIPPQGLEKSLQRIINLSHFSIYPTFFFFSCRS